MHKWGKRRGRSKASWTLEPRLRSAYPVFSAGPDSECLYSLDLILDLGETPSICQVGHISAPVTSCKPGKWLHRPAQSGTVHEYGIRHVHYLELCSNKGSGIFSLELWSDMDLDVFTSESWLSQASFQCVQRKSITVWMACLLTICPNSLTHKEMTLGPMIPSGTLFSRDAFVPYQLRKVNRGVAVFPISS